MVKRTVTVCVTAIFMAVVFCSVFGFANSMQDHSTSKVKQCCSVVSSGLALGSGVAAKAFFTSMIFFLILTFFVPSKLAEPPYHPPRYRLTS
ncbi:MAG: hypothetical protein IEMM0002_0238 [bacterium]|nr:MAG: hypothetical protein IEMM0002_0238 [bacterium]